MRTHSALAMRLKCPLAHDVLRKVSGSLAAVRRRWRPQRSNLIASRILRVNAPPCRAAFSAFLNDLSRGSIALGANLRREILLGACGACANAHVMGLSAVERGEVP